MQNVGVGVLDDPLNLITNEELGMKEGKNAIRLFAVINLYYNYSFYNKICGSAGIGRQARLRGVCL